MRSCNHIKSDGRPCNAPALRKHSYCFFHQQQVNRRRREYPDRLPILEDRAAVQVAIMQVLDRIYLKTIDYKAAALMLYGLQLATTNLKQDIFGRLNSEKVDRYYGNANEADRPQPAVSTPKKPPQSAADALNGDRHPKTLSPVIPSEGVSPTRDLLFPFSHSASAPSKPAVDLSGSVVSLAEERYERCPRSHAEGVDLGFDASNPDFGLGGNAAVPEARNEGSPARSAGF